MRWLSFLIFSVYFLLYLLLSPVFSVEIDRLLTKVSPSIVTIVSKQLPAQDFFCPPVPQGVGSGVVVDAQGLILAPAPLVREAQWIDVILSNGQQCGASIVGIDYFCEVALLKLKCSAKVKPVLFASAFPKVGQKIVLIGRPRLALSVSRGMVSESAVFVSQQGLLVPDMVAAHIDIAPVGQGPIFGLQGRLLGLAVDLPNFHYPGGIYFVPAKRLYWAYKLLKDKQEAAWPWLGLEVITLYPTVAKVLHLPVSQGVMITRVFPGSPAARAGLRSGRKELSIGNFIYRPGDVIVAINGRPVHSARQFFYEIWKQKPGTPVLLTVYRGRTRHQVKIFLRRRIFLHP